MEKDRDFEKNTLLLPRQVGFTPHLSLLFPDLKNALQNLLKLFQVSLSTNPGSSAEMFSHFNFFA